MNQAIEPAEIQDLRQSDVPAILPLNNAHAAETSHLEEASLRSLLAICVYARGIDNGRTALLLALDQDAPYVNPNFHWFKEHRRSFLMCRVRRCQLLRHCQALLQYLRRAQAAFVREVEVGGELLG